MAKYSRLDELYGEDVYDESAMYAASYKRPTHGRTNANTQNIVNELELHEYDDVELYTRSGNGNGMAFRSKRGEENEADEESLMGVDMSENFEINSSTAALLSEVYHNADVVVEGGKCETRDWMYWMVSAVLGLICGFALMKTGLFDPKLSYGQFTFEHWQLSKVYLVAVGASMLFQGIYQAIDKEKFAECRSLSTQRGIGAAVVGSCICGIGIGLCGATVELMFVQGGTGAWSGLIAAGGSSMHVYACI